jgi:hypothetical protein
MIAERASAHRVLKVFHLVISCPLIAPIVGRAFHRVNRRHVGKGQSRPAHRSDADRFTGVCGGPPVEAHHVIPLAEGGAGIMGNMVTLCWAATIGGTARSRVKRRILSAVGNRLHQSQREASSRRLWRRCLFGNRRSYRAADGQNTCAKRGRGVRCTYYANGRTQG